MILYLNSVKSTCLLLKAGWNRGYCSYVVLTSHVCSDSMLWMERLGISYAGSYIVWIREQWYYSLGSSQCFDGARIPGASHNRGIRLCHPCHSPGFINRKSGNETAFLPPSGTQAGWTADKEGHSHLTLRGILSFPFVKINNPTTYLSVLVTKVQSC